MENAFCLEEERETHFFDALNVKKGHLGLSLLECLYQMYSYWMWLVSKDLFWNAVMVSGHLNGAAFLSETYWLSWPSAVLSYTVCVCFIDSAIFWELILKPGPPCSEYVRCMVSASWPTVPHYITWSMWQDILIFLKSICFLHFDCCLVTRCFLFKCIEQFSLKVLLTPCVKDTQINLSILPTERRKNTQTHQ